MLRNILLFNLLLLTTLLNAQNAQWKWATSVNGPTNEDEIDALASDDDANVYISGKFEDSLFFNNYNDTLISNGMADIMLMKYDSLGNLIWYKHFGGLGEDNAFDAVCDQSGNLIVSGYFQQTVQFGTETLTSSGGFDAFIIKFDPTGNVIWALQFGGTGDEGGNEVSMSNNNTIIASADADGDFSLGSFTMTNTGNRDAYIMSITENGVVEWIRAIEGAGGVRSKSVAVDENGNIFYGGDFFGSNEVVDESSNGHAFTFVGNKDAYLTCWTSEGDLKWYKTWGGSGFEYCKGLATNSSGEVFAAGPFENTVNFEGTALSSAGGIDFFLWKLDSTGNALWIRQLSSPSDVLEGGELIEDGQDGVAFGMGMEDTFTIDDETGTQQFLLPTPGTTYPILLRYDATGKVVTTLMADNSLYATSGEISRSGNFIFLDLPYGGGVTLGNTTLTTTPLANKDGALACIDIQDLGAGIPTFSDLDEDLYFYPNPARNFISRSNSACSIRACCCSISSLQSLLNHACSRASLYMYYPTFFLG